MYRMVCMMYELHWNLPAQENKFTRFAYDHFDVSLNSCCTIEINTRSVYKTCKFIASYVRGYFGHNEFVWENHLFPNYEPKALIIILFFQATYFFLTKSKHITIRVTRIRSRGCYEKEPFEIQNWKIKSYKTETTKKRDSFNFDVIHFLIENLFSIHKRWLYWSFEHTQQQTTTNLLICVIKLDLHQTNCTRWKAEG